MTEELRRRIEAEGLRAETHDLPVNAVPSVLLPVTPADWQFEGPRAWVDPAPIGIKPMGYLKDLDNPDYKPPPVSTWREPFKDRVARRISFARWKLASWIAGYDVKEDDGYY